MNTNIFLFITANEHEREAFEKKFLRQKEKYILCKTYYLGMFGCYPAAYIHMDEQGVTAAAATPLVSELVRELQPVAVVMVGIAFGADEGKQKIGDVLVSDKILPYDSQKLLEDKTEYKETLKEVGFQLLNAFREHREWIHHLPNSERSNVNIGAILTGSRLVNKFEYRTQLLEDFAANKPIGGEMEAQGIYSMCRLHGVAEWIIVKGICDWGYKKNNPNKETDQAIAANAAVDYCFHVFSRVGIFADLIRKSAVDIGTMDDLTANNIADINESFLKKMFDPLFLEKSNGKQSSKRTLNDLYILPKVIDTKFDASLMRKLSISPLHRTEAIIECFLEGQEISASTLIVEGAPGVGKTSFLSYLVNLYHSKNNLFGINKVICISLISLVKRFGGEGLDANPIAFLLRYISAILNFNVDERILKNSLILLDGLDEICSVENLNIKRFCESIVNSSIFNDKIVFHVIMTSRSGYIKYSDRNLLKITLAEFSDSEFYAFGKKYFSFIGFDIGENYKKNMKLLVDKPKYAGIFGIPILLYIITALDYVLSDYKNICDVYESLFETLEKRSYGPKRNQKEQEHPVYEIIDVVLARKIAQNIAFKMLENKTLWLSLTDESYISPVEEAIKEHDSITAADKEKIQELFLLTFYYKSDKEAVEFAHRTIQEYFVAEKIRDELLNLTENMSSDIVAAKFVELFGRGIISNEIYIFLVCLLEKLTNVEKEKYAIIFTTHLKNLIENDLFIGVVHSASIKSRQCIQQIFVIIWNIIKLLNGTQCLSTNINLTELYFIMRFALTLSNNPPLIPVCLNGEQFEKAELSEISLSKAKIHNVNMKNSKLRNVDFSEASICNTDFSEAQLHGAILQSKLDNCFFNKTMFINAILSGCNMNSIEIKLSCFSLADLSFSEFTNCTLTCNDFTAANLKGATFINTDLTSSIFCSTDLRNVEFIKCNLTETIFSAAIIGNTVFKDVIISNKTKAKLERKGAVFVDFDKTKSIGGIRNDS